jgi:hypothetical protein
VEEDGRPSSSRSNVRARRRWCTACLARSILARNRTRCVGAAQLAQMATRPAVSVGDRRRTRVPARVARRPTAPRGRSGFRLPDPIVVDAANIRRKGALLVTRGSRPLVVLDSLTVRSAGAHAARQVPTPHKRDRTHRAHVAGVHVDAANWACHRTRLCGLVGVSPDSELVW